MDVERPKSSNGPPMIIETNIPEDLVIKEECEKLNTQCSVIDPE